MLTVVSTSVVLYTFEIVYLKTLMPLVFEQHQAMSHVRVCSSGCLMVLALVSAGPTRLK